MIVIEHLRKHLVYNSVGKEVIGFSSDDRWRMKLRVAVSYEYTLIKVAQFYYGRDLFGSIAPLLDICKKK